MNVPVFARQLLEQERAARKALERGVDDDEQWLDRLVSSHVHKAKRDAYERLLSLGSVDEDVRGTFFSLETMDIAARCVRDVFANADVRFRARFLDYADALAALQEHLTGSAQRRLTLPHVISENADAIALFGQESPPDVEAWARTLETRLRSELRRAVDAALRITKKRGLMSLARCRIARMRASIL